MSFPLKILFLASEADPFFKVGGLGDYAGSLPNALRLVAEKEGLPLDIRVALPFHQSIAVDSSGFSQIAKLEVPMKKGTAKGSALLHTHNGIPYYFIRRAGKPGGFSKVYNSSPIKDARKYIFFSLASLQLARMLDWQPDIIHANDWHTAVTVYQLKRIKQTDPFFMQTCSLLVIHNLPFMGAGTEEVLNEFDIPPLDSPLLPVWSRHFPLVLGLAAADEIAAVSPSYMQELKQEEFGNGLKDFFISEENRTTGILNGIDYGIWNPEKDIQLPFNYSSDQLINKEKNKEEIIKAAGLRHDSTTPLLVAVSRLDIQKGTDLIISTIPELLEMNWNLIILGSGNEDYESSVLELQNRYPERIHTYLEFNSPLAHRLYAAGDIFLMPSRYEPCGLSQMIAMRYGCIPVARAVGGLRDTINTESEDLRTGYLFKDATVSSFSGSLHQAIRDYQDADKWHEMRIRAMNTDLSWEKSAGKYLQVYQDLKNRSIK